MIKGSQRIELAGSLVATNLALGSEKKPPEPTWTFGLNHLDSCPGGLTRGTVANRRQHEATRGNKRQQTEGPVASPSVSCLLLAFVTAVGPVPRPIVRIRAAVRTEGPVGWTVDTIPYTGHIESWLTDLLEPTSLAAGNFVACY